MKTNGFEITEWNARDGSPILYPKTMIGPEKSRGGCFIAAPNFGTPPTTGLWQKTNLAKHGLVRLLRNGGHCDTEVEEFGKVTMRKVFEADVQFPWTHRLESTVLYREGPHRLVHHLSIERLAVAGEEGLMPLSFGLHPYFATHGGPFEVQIGNKTIATDAYDLRNGLRENMMLGITLETIRGTVEIHPHGYDQWNIWSDNNAEYVCIEPTRGRLYDLALAANNPLQAYCQFEYTPKTV